MPLLPVSFPKVGVARTPLKIVGNTVKNVPLASLRDSRQGFGTWWTRCPKAGNGHVLLQILHRATHDARRTNQRRGAKAFLHGTVHVLKMMRQGILHNETLVAFPFFVCGLNIPIDSQYGLFSDEK